MTDFTREDMRERSITEEVVGILWAVLASVTTSKIVAVIAWGMAGVAFAAALYFALARHEE